MRTHPIRTSIASQGQRGSPSSFAVGASPSLARWRDDSEPIYGRSARPAARVGRGRHSMGGEWEPGDVCLLRSSPPFSLLLHLP